MSTQVTCRSASRLDVLAAGVGHCLDDALLVGVVVVPGLVPAAAAVRRLQRVPTLPEKGVRIVPIVWQID